MGERKFRYHMLALAVVLVWGVTFVCTKVLIAAGLHPVDIFWIRFVLAYAGIWLYIVLTGRDRKLWYGWKEELVFLFLGITGGSFYFLTENTALAHTQASNVSFLVCSAPLFTAIFTLIYRRYGHGRFAEALNRKDKLGSYLKRLFDAFNPATTEGMMCRDQISVDYAGEVYDCDFNQAIGLKIKGAKTIFDFAREKQPVRSIVFANHCYACTAGAGSS